MSLRAPDPSSFFWQISKNWLGNPRSLGQVTRRVSTYTAPPGPVTALAQVPSDQTFQCHFTGCAEELDFEPLLPFRNTLLPVGFMITPLSASPLAVSLDHVLDSECQVLEFASLGSELPSALSVPS